MPYTETEHDRIYYTKNHGPEGGPNIVLIHGAGGNRLHWPGELRRLSGATAYTLDLPGHGRSEGRGYEYIADYVQAVRGFLDAVGIDQAFVTGHSMGGAIAMTLALNHANYVAGLILIATGARLRVSPKLLKMIPSDFQGSVDFITRFAWSPKAPRELVEIGRKALQETAPHTVLGDFMACDRFDVMDQVEKIDVPTLVVTGSSDQLTPVKYARFLEETIPETELVILDQAGHMVMVERPQEVRKAVLDFLKQQVPALSSQEES